MLKYFLLFQNLHADNCNREIDVEPDGCVHLNFETEMVQKKQNWTWPTRSVWPII